MPSTEPIATVSDFANRIREDARHWKPIFPWFRGERDARFSTLLPQVFREPYDENNLLQSFRRRAHLLSLPVIPPVTAIDQWLFLARHVGLPTRLLDWTEGALIALYFALAKVEEYERERERFKAHEAPRANAVVWMLHPMRLNWLAELYEKAGQQEDLPEEPKGNYYGLTWYDPGMGGVPRVNIAHANIARAWTLRTGGIHVPVAIEPTTIHPRMNAQHSYFTVHGTDERPLHRVLSDALAQVRRKRICRYRLRDVLLRYKISIKPTEGMAELRTLGIADSTVMPDADSLAKELRRFMVVEAGDPATPRSRKR